MTVRIPLTMFEKDGTPGNWHIKEMSSTLINQQIIALATLWGNTTTNNTMSGNRSGVHISAVSPNGGFYNNFDTGGSAAGVASSIDVSFVDERYDPGEPATSVSSFPGEATTAEPVLVSTTYDMLKVYVNTFGVPYGDQDKKYPLFYNSSGHLQCMTEDDLADTFIYPAMEYLAGLSSIPGAPSAEDAPGGYKVVGRSGYSGDANEGVAPTAPTGYHLCGGNTALSSPTESTDSPSGMIFKDTFADQTKYTDGTAQNEIPSTNDGTNTYYEYVEYWLYQKDKTTDTWEDIAPSAEGPLIVKQNNSSAKDLMIADPTDLQAGSPSQIGSYQQALVALMYRYAAGSQGAGTKRFTFRIVDATTTSLDIMGTIMNNSIVNATGQAGTRYTRYVNTNDYRSQEFPVGTVSVADQYALVLDPYTTV